MRRGLVLCLGLDGETKRDCEAEVTGVPKRVGWLWRERRPQGTLALRYRCLEQTLFKEGKYEEERKKEDDPTSLPEARHQSISSMANEASQKQEHVPGSNPHPTTILI